MDRDWTGNGKATILLLLFLTFVSCKTHKCVVEQSSASRSDSVSVSSTASVAIERTVTVKDSTEVRDSTATEYIVGRFDSVVGARVDTVKQYCWHYERKTTDRDKDSEQKQAMATTTTATVSQSATTVVNEETSKAIPECAWAIIALLFGGIIVVYRYIKKNK